MYYSNIFAWGTAAFSIAIYYSKPCLLFASVFYYKRVKSKLQKYNFFPIQGNFSNAVK